MGGRAGRSTQPRTIRVDRLERMRIQKAERVRVEKVTPPSPVRKGMRPRV
jgi:hypothetical protein